MAKLAVRNIHKSFDRTEVLRGVDLDIAHGEFISLVGPSGCGKSTLLRIIAGLERQSEGAVLIEARDVTGVTASRRDLAMVFQSYALYPHLSVFDNIAVPLRMRRLNAWQRLPLAPLLVPGTRRIQREIRTDVERAASLLGLTELLARRPGQLSGGQRQRVAVGRAIVRQPKAFLLDEPLSNLDAKLRVHMRTEIAQLHRSLGATFIYVTHDQAEAMTMSDRIAVMMDGNIVQVGTPDEVYNRPQDIRVAEFIGSPKINVLPGRVDAEGRVHVLGLTLDQRLEAAPGTQVQVGIRPEAVRPAATAAEPAWRGTVSHAENMGSEVFLHAAITGLDAPVLCRLEPGEARTLGVGSPVALVPKPAAPSFFDRDGHRVGVRPVTYRQVVNG
ncbi:ABC transporter ATP-binding protein [Reyranella sp.]|uniref:ABC transporter ATP-binding protein n=1 Tax=Reyranella sp. TaxID=1929291 RepID=UPI003BAB32FA